MKITLAELRNFVQLEFLGEAFDIATVANRGLSSKGIIIVKSPTSSKLEYIVAVSTKEFVTYKDAYNSELPKILGGVTGEWNGKEWIIVQLHALDPSTAVMLLGAALEKWNRVTPDEITTPAAQSIIKKYFELHKNDPDKIENPEEGFLEAVYLGPIGFDISSALSSGESAAESCVGGSMFTKDIDRVKAWIQVIANKGFRSAFNDSKRTKET